MLLFSTGISQVAPEIHSTMQAINRLGTILIFPWRLNLDPQFLDLVQQEYNDVRCSKQSVLPRSLAFFSAGLANRDSDIRKLESFCRPRNVPESTMLALTFQSIPHCEPFGLFGLLPPACFSKHDRGRQWLQLVLRCVTCKCYTFVLSTNRLCVYCECQLQGSASVPSRFRYPSFLPVFFLFFRCSLQFSFSFARFFKQSKFSSNFRGS
jgi:hypothetical protein